MSKLTILTTIVLGFAGSAYAEGTYSSNHKASKTEAAAQIGAAQTSEIRFERGQSALSETAKREIRNVVEKQNASGKKVDELKVAVWSDREYPTQAQQGTIAKSDVELAKKREQAIKDYVKKDLALDVETFNMSERPNALQKFMGTDTAEVKKALGGRGSTASADGVNMQEGNKASKAVIMVFTE